MKKSIVYLGLLLALAGVLAPACGKEPVVEPEQPVNPQPEPGPGPEPEPTVKTVNATLDGYVWQKGDAFAVISGQTVSKFTTFEAQAQAAFTADRWPEDGQSGTAVFPYRSDWSMSGGQPVFTLPSVWPVLPGIRQGGVAVADYDEKGMVFHYLTAFVEFSLSREDITAFTLYKGDETQAFLSLDDVPRAGLYSLAVQPGNYPSIRMVMATAGGMQTDVTLTGSSVAAGEILSLGVLDGQADWEVLPELEVIATTSSTASFTWTVTGFRDAVRDIDFDWSVGLYRDASCSDLVVSWDVPKRSWYNLEGISIYAWGGPFSPRFSFSGLSAGTTYYAKAWYTGRPDRCSNIVAVTTDDFTPVTLPASQTAAGDVILREDFSQLILGGNLPDRAYGYSDALRASITSLDPATGANPVGEQVIGGVNHNFNLCSMGQVMGLFNTLGTALPSTRLAAWSSITDENTAGIVSALSGCVRLGSASKNAAVVTPELSCLPDKAKVEVSFLVYPYIEKAFDLTDGTVAVIAPGASGSNGLLTSYEVLSSENFSVSAYPKWQRVTLEAEVPRGGRIAISTRHNVKDGSITPSRLTVDEVTLTYKEEIIVTKIYQVSTAAELADFLSMASDYTAAETVTLTADIDLAGVSLPTASAFTGTFDGNGKSLKNWAASGALFNAMSGTVKDLTVESSCSLTLPASADGAFFVLANTGTVQNCHNKAAISGTTSDSGTRCVGAIVARNEAASGTITGCTNSGAFNLTVNAADIYVGGVAGNANSGVISHCHNLAGGNLTVKAGTTATQARVGGVVGMANAGYTSCSNAAATLSYTGGAWHKSSFNSIGGVCGWAGGKTVNGSESNWNFNTADITVSTPSRLRVGGVNGCTTQVNNYVRNTGSIDVTVTGTSTVQEVGGINGYGRAVNHGETSGNVSFHRTMTDGTSAEVALCGVGLHTGIVSAAVAHTDCTVSGVLTLDIASGVTMPAGASAGILGANLELKTYKVLSGTSVCGTALDAGNYENYLVGNVNGNTLTKTSVSFE